MLLRSLFTIIITLLLVNTGIGHALWIETSPAGKKGQLQEVRIYFGEFSGKDLSATGKWFSDLASFTLVAVAPDGSRTTLSTVAGGDHYKANFTPSQDGIYTLIAHHMAKDPYKGIKLDYNSGATVAVGNSLKSNDPLVNTNVVSLFIDSAFAIQANRPARIKALYEGKPAARQEIKVVAPNGWEKMLYSNADGEVQFTPLWPGTYLVEYTLTDKTPGDHNGKAYTEVRKISTYALQVKGS